MVFKDHATVAPPFAGKILHILAGRMSMRGAPSDNAGPCVPVSLLDLKVLPDLAQHWSRPVLLKVVHLHTSSSILHTPDSCELQTFHGKHHLIASSSAFCPLPSEAASLPGNTRLKRCRGTFDSQEPQTSSGGTTNQHFARSAHSACQSHVTEQRKISRATQVRGGGRRQRQLCILVSPN